MKKIIVTIFSLLVIFNVALWYFLDQGTRQALVTVGDSNDLSLFDDTRVLADPALGVDVPDVQQYGTLSVFLAALGIQATILLAFFTPGTRLIFPTNLSVRSRRKSRLLCIGMGGTGKTTLIENALMDNEDTPTVTQEFSVYSTTRHVNDELSDVVIYDPIGQDWDNLVRQVILLEQHQGIIDHVVILVGVAEVVAKGDVYELQVPENFMELGSASIVSAQNDRLREDVLGPIIRPLKNLKRVTLMYNHLDVFCERKEGQIRMDTDYAIRFYSDSFKPLQSEIEKVVESYNENKNSSKKRRSIFGPSRRHERLQFSINYVSTQWAISLDSENARIVPLTRALFPR